MLRGEPKKRDAVAGDVLEHIPSRAAVILKIGERHPAQAAARGAVSRDDHQAFAVPDRQRPQNDGVDHAGAGTIEAYAERKRQNANECETWRFPRHSSFLTYER